MENSNFSETFQTYDIADKGKYVCMQCGNEDKNGIVSMKQDEMLPECKKCGYTSWIKINV